MQHRCRSARSTRPGESDREPARPPARRAARRRPRSIRAEARDHREPHCDIEALRGNPRTLSPLNTDAVSELDTPLVDAALMDPEAPVNPDKLLDDFVPLESRPPARSRLIGIAAFIFVLAALAAAWRFSPLHQWLNLESLVDIGDRIEEMPFTPLIVLGAYVV